MLIQKIKDYQIILATQSPRRHYLMQEAGFDFIVSDLHSVEEKYPNGLDKYEIPIYLAELKSNAYSKSLEEDEILITADTIVWLQNRLIGKPKNPEDAFRILKKLAGNMHEVITGVSIRTKNIFHSFYAHTEVFFSKINDEELRFYIESQNPLDKAGAYGIQDWIGFIGIEKIRGSYFNVMGLPIQKLYRELENIIS